MISDAAWEYSDDITILRSRTGVLTKRIEQCADGLNIVPFSAGQFYSVHERSVPTFQAMAELLPKVASDPAACIVRGRPLPGIDRKKARRLCDRNEHGDAITFDACARSWLALDIDGVPDPDCFPADPAGGVEHVLGVLPEPFQEASCWWQATSSAGIKPGIRARLWFHLSRPVSDAEAKGWLATAPVDKSLYSAVTPHYVAPPILERGVADPVALRCGVRQGLDDQVDVPDELPLVEAVTADIDLTGTEPSEDDLVQLGLALLRSRLLERIWTGQKTYPDRSSTHFGLAVALATAGVTHPDSIHRLLIDHDRQHRVELSKICGLIMRAGPSLPH